MTRVAVARALISKPEVVFADEPTGALDSKASNELLQFLRSVVDDLGQTVLMVTHDPRAAAYADRVVFLVDGRVVEVTVGGLVKIPRGGLLFSSPLDRPITAVSGDARLVAPGADEIRIEKLPATFSVRY